MIGKSTWEPEGETRYEVMDKQGNVIDILTYPYPIPGNELFPTEQKLKEKYGKIIKLRMVR